MSSSFLIEISHNPQWGFFVNAWILQKIEKVTKLQVMPKGWYLLDFSIL